MTITSNIHYGLPNWASSHIYNVAGVRVANGGNAYQVVGTGTSASSGGPSGTGSGITDGTVTWKFLSHIDFTDLPSWANSIPGTLSQQIIGQLWNNRPIVDSDRTVQNPFGTNSWLVLTGHTTTPTNNIILTCAPGESFRDKMLGQNVPLAFNSANGVSFVAASSGISGVDLIWFDDANVSFDGLQFLDPNSNSQSTFIGMENTNGNPTNCFIRHCIFDGFAQSSAGGAYIINNSSASSNYKMSNCLIVDRQPANGSQQCIAIDGAGALINCTVISVNSGIADPGCGISFKSAAASMYARNCIFYGYDLPIRADAGGATGDHCVTGRPNLGSGVTDAGGNIFNVTAPNQFVNFPTDFRIKSGSSCVNAGVTDIGDVPSGNDIVGNTRDSQWDIGCFELVSAPTPSIVINTIAPQQSNSLFQISGTLSNYISPPTLSYSDDGGVLQPLPSGSTVSTTSFLFTHPGLSAANHVVKVQDTNSASATSNNFAVTSPPPPPPGVGTLSAKINNVNLTSGGTAIDVSGDVVSCAFDFNARLFWFTSQAMRAQFGPNAWNCSASADPSTGVGGLSLSTLTTGSYFPAFGDLEGGSSCTINTGGSSFSITLPAGFQTWGGTGGALVTPPGQVTGLSNGTMTSSAAPLTWSAPITGSSVTQYQVNYRKTGTSVWYLGPLVGNQTNAVVTSLIASTSYDFQIFAINAGGTGQASPSVTASTLPATINSLDFRGVNYRGGDMTLISGLPSAFPHINSVVLPVFCSTANQTSTDITLTTTLPTIGGWIDTANAGGLDVFLAVYVIPRDGSATQTITPGPSLAGVATFMSNLQTVCAQVAQLGQQHNAVGMFCGVELQPWGGSSVDTGPFSSLHVAQWQSVYNACKAVWPTGIISYAALQTSLGFLTPTGSWSVDWSVWDAIAVDLYPGSSNSLTTTNDFQNFFDTTADPDPNTDSSVGTQPLFTALINYSNSVGRKIIINQCGIIPAQGNQIAPGLQNVLPPPFNFALQSAWWQAVMAEVIKNIANFSGFFAWDGGASNFNSPFVGINYWGIQGTASQQMVDNSFSTLTGVPSTLGVPTNLQITSTTQSSIVLSWTAVSGAGITYVVQYSLDGANTWNSLPATANTSNTVTGLNSATTYDLRVFAVQGTAIGVFSNQIVATTSGTVPQSITITNPGTRTSGVPFQVQGTLAGFSSIPNLYYLDDATVSAVPNITDTVTTTSVTLNWGTVAPVAPLPFPSGSIVSTTSFSYTNPSLPIGTHKLTVTTGIVSNSINITVQ